MTARPYGVGIGWRPEIAGFVAELPGLRFVEVVAESVHDHGPAAGRASTELRDRGVAVVPHGVKLSLGGAEPVDPARVAHLAAVAERLGRAAGQRAHRVRPGRRRRGRAPAAAAPQPGRRRRGRRQRPAYPGRAARADRAGADRGALRLARRRARRGRSSSPRSWTAPTRCCCSTSPTSTRTRATGAPTRSRCSTRLPLERVAYVHVAGRRRARRHLPRHAHRRRTAAGARPGRRAVRAAPPAGADAGTRRRLPAGRRRCAPSSTRSPPRPAIRRSRDRRARADRQAALVADPDLGGTRTPGIRRRGWSASPGPRCCASGPARSRGQWPVLAAALGDEWRAAFAAWARRPADRTARCATAGIWPGRWHRCPAAAAAELAAREAAWRVRRPERPDPPGPAVRMGPAPAI